MSSKDDHFPDTVKVRAKGLQEGAGGSHQPNKPWNKDPYKPIRISNRISAVRVGFTLKKNRLLPTYMFNLVAFSHFELSDSNMDVSKK